MTLDSADMSNLEFLITAHGNDREACLFAVPLVEPGMGARTCEWAVDGRKDVKTYVLLSPFFGDAAEYGVRLALHAAHHAKYGVSRYLAYALEGFNQLRANPHVQELVAQGALRVVLMDDLPVFFRNVTQEGAQRYPYAVQLLTACSPSGRSRANVVIRRRVGHYTGRVPFKGPVPSAQELAQGAVNERQLWHNWDGARPLSTHPLSLYGLHSLDHHPPHISIKSVFCVHQVATAWAHFAGPRKGYHRGQCSQDHVFWLHIVSQVAHRQPKLDANGSLVDARWIEPKFLWAHNGSAANCKTGPAAARTVAPGESNLAREG
ncbi:hypothetical protein GPECTOR_14g222 [Gonium pectorale]|uniref:Uncharacterized protein n=1 Tax=Gonium pectorale TaxID=33097 RepID=A0A150GNS1_GONPE|nr:hypothetical protein GPECTOR_14g222 [Gonium pectorale]|eukprot:KXZ50980.1 hypothetical protein GPECTOR_14g222 [Gonium pectorale]